MIFVEKTVCIDEIRIRTAQFSGAHIHQIRKIIDRTADIFRNGIGNFVRGSD